jgi:transketolase
MRKHFSNLIGRIAAENDDVVFITGDLGYNALENLADIMGDRFINAGVAEQNMVGMAAGMAYRGFRVICYSIAPFVVYRCLEQVRNDVCFHNLPVFIVGNGGGYGYGIMGSSHHCIEDVACFSGLPNMRVYAPSFVEDMDQCIEEMFERRGPAYLRLGLGKNLPGNMELTNYGAAPRTWGQASVTIVAQSPVANNVIEAINQSGQADNIDFFVVNRMPQIALPQALAASMAATGNVITVEEHIATGGLGQTVSSLIHASGLPVYRFTSLHAQGYPSGLYGSQSFHQAESGLDAGNILNVINSYFHRS